MKKKTKKRKKEKKMGMYLNHVKWSDLRWNEIRKIEAMLQEEKIRHIEKYVLNEYLKSLTRE